MTLTRYALLAIVFFVLSGALFYAWKIGIDDKIKELDAKAKAFEERMGAKGIIVYARHDVPEGYTISSDAIELKEIEQSKIPQDACVLSSQVIGRTAKYGISQGQIISTYDLAPPDSLPRGFIRIKNDER